MCRICKLFSPRAFLTRVYTDLKNISEFVRPQHTWGSSELNLFENAVLVLEDRRYATHCGIDLRSAIREIWRWATFRKHGGASTIEMQFVRTCTGYKERTLERKLYEMLLAYLITIRHRKLSILRAYLDIVYLGNRLKGGDATSEAIFAQDINDLDTSQACQLAAMMVYPKPLNPSAEWIRKVMRRAAYAEKLLHRIKFSFPVEE